MRYAILINTNSSARQLKRLIEKLNNGLFDFYIHIDKRLEISHYKHVLGLTNVYQINQRINTKPGGYSNVKATLNGLKQILETDIDYSFITLLSGRDYPIKSAEVIASFFKENSGKQFIKFNDKWASRHPASVNRYHLLDYNFFGKKAVESLMNVFLRKPNAPKNLTIVGQSACWSLSLSCVRYVVQYMQRFKFERFLKYTKNCDKFIFQSIIMNSSFKLDVVNNDCRYTDEQPGAGHPKLLTIKDFYQITTSDCLFASRFDIREDEKILTMIDQANKQQPLGFDKLA